tara:strand:+ start:1690 stop:1971 length:282 start_codon:yes stop_codon:yes gene_type:complete
MLGGIIKFFLRLMGWVYVFIEQFVSYPNDGNILGMDIDEDFQKMSRRELCAYIDSMNDKNKSNITFWDLDSTTKIRYGCQIARLNGLVKDGRK